ncbi:OLC1v1015899C1 [Oldenlandia corymbosa var. corymbosa]|uniref:OLC1v1015899C1 n=1 Tax=Oldenlandia corymbosa var. corymbosa TaxID=529605 RepID=A0AAV1E4P5_OLDCO|nr:OLC1v1015899C1 [Oldenlandia corymbosa var. corymbosa]
MKILVTLFGIFLSIFCVREVNGGTAVKDEYFPHSAIRTVKTTSGDTYDCIDKLSQPGLQNPALVEKIKLGKNGTIHQSVGDVLPNGSSKNESKGFDLDKIWAGQRCPAGTVPIPQKTGKLQKFVFPPKALRQMASSDYNGGTQFVGIVVDEGELMGGHAEMTVWNPNPVSPGQYSAASIIIENGTEAIEAGWIVHPDLYQDTKTRLYTAWRNEKGGYYNTDYPGFVVVNEDIPLNYAFPRTSDTFGESDQVKITIQRTVFYY